MACAHNAPRALSRCSHTSSTNHPIFISGDWSWLLPRVEARTCNQTQQLPGHVRQRSPHVPYTTTPLISTWVHSCCLTSPYKVQCSRHLSEFVVKSATCLLSRRLSLNRRPQPNVNAINPRLRKSACKEHLLPCPHCKVCPRNYWRSFFSIA